MLRKIMRAMGREIITDLAILVRAVVMVTIGIVIIVIPIVLIFLLVVTLTPPATG